MTRGLMALLFLVMSVVIIFLAFQVNENANKCKDTRIHHQEDLKKVARLTVQSVNQTHPLFQYAHILEAKLLLDQVVGVHGGVSTTERALKMTKGKLERLKQDVYQQYQDVEQFMMDRILQVRPELNVLINEDAQLMAQTPPSAPSSRPRRHKHKHRRDRDRDRD